MRNARSTRTFFLRFMITVIALTVPVWTSFAAEPRTTPRSPINIYAKNGMVTAAHYLASQAGMEVMAKGGNAIDAAVATALALNLVEPYNTGIGGGGFMTVRFAKTGEVVFLDFREMAPASARKDMYDSEQARKERWSTVGGKAAGVPGWVKGLFYALDEYGTMSFEQVMQPAIRIAENGFEWSQAQYNLLADGSNFEEMTNVNGDGKHVPYFEDGLPIPAGTILKVPGVAKAFRLLAKDGPDAFYKGPIGEAFVKTVNATGGEMTMQDLANYKVVVRRPVSGTYRGYQIYSSAPPSSGGTHIIQLLNFMENFDVAGMPLDSPQMLHLWGQAENMVFADRSAYMADTDFVKVPLEGLSSKEYAKTMVERFDKDKYQKLDQPGDPWKFETKQQKSQLGPRGGNEYHSTTHFSTVDREGNIVAVTSTINWGFGCKAIVPEYQFLINNQMDDFAMDPQSVNAPEPGKRPLSSMSPTIVLDPQGRPFMTVGSAGAKMILTNVAQVISHVIDRKMTMSEAIEAPRVSPWIFANTQGQTLVEASAGKESLEALKKMGYPIDDTSTYHGVCQGIVFYQDRELMEGASDQRSGTGMPAGF